MKWYRIYTHYYKDFTLATPVDGSLDLIRVGKGDITEECLGDFKATSVWAALEQAWQRWESGNEAVITQRSSMVGDGMRVEFLNELFGEPTDTMLYSVDKSTFTHGFSKYVSLL
jgi:hypothetical protein